MGAAVQVLDASGRMDILLLTGGLAHRDVAGRLSKAAHVVVPRVVVEGPEGVGRGIRGASSVNGTK